MVVLVLTIKKQSSDIALLLCLCGCCMIMAVALSFFVPILDFVRKLQQMAGLDGQMLQILLKVTGVAFTTEIAATVCADAGNAAMGKSLQILSALVIMYLSIPMMETLLDLVERILVAL